MKIVELNKDFIIQAFVKLKPLSFSYLKSHFQNRKNTSKTDGKLSTVNLEVKTHIMKLRGKPTN